MGSGGGGGAGAYPEPGQADISSLRCWDTNNHTHSRVIFHIFLFFIVLVKQVSWTFKYVIE